jgi:hypothetical protein
LQDKFATIVACTFGFPEFLGFSVRVFLKVGASVAGEVCGMDCTDEVWVAGLEETAIALRDFGHGVLGFWFSLPQKRGGRSQMALCSERGCNLLLKVPDLEIAMRAPS